jgi:predicted nucleic acid-binding protein
VTPPPGEWQTIHQNAAAFLTSCLEDRELTLALSAYQIAEILDVLRKHRYPTERRLGVLRSFRQAKFSIVDVTHQHVENSVELSIASGIHVYDYLVAQPVKGIVSAIYSADDHFLHPHFQTVAPVTNPLAPWVLREGRAPEMRSVESHRDLEKL